MRLFTLSACGRACVHACVCAWGCVHACLCVHACVRMRARAHVRARMRVRTRMPVRARAAVYRAIVSARIDTADLRREPSASAGEASVKGDLQRGEASECGVPACAHVPLLQSRSPRRACLCMRVSRLCGRVCVRVCGRVCVRVCGCVCVCVCV